MSAAAASVTDGGFAFEVSSAGRAMVSSAGAAVVGRGAAVVGSGAFPPPSSSGPQAASSVPRTSTKQIGATRTANALRFGDTLQLSTAVVRAYTLTPGGVWDQSPPAS